MKIYTVYHILIYTSIASGLIPLWYSFVNYKSFNKQMKALFIYLVISVLTDAGSRILNMTEYKSSVLELYFSFSVFDFFFISYIYWLEFRKKSYRIMISFLCLIYVIGIFIPFLQHKKIDAIDSIISVIEAIIIILLSIIFLFKTTLDLEIPKPKDYPFFWLNSAFLFYFGTNFFMLLFNNTLKEFDHTTVYFIISIRPVTNIAYNLLIAKAVCKIKKI